MSQQSGAMAIMASAEVCDSLDSFSNSSWVPSMLQGMKTPTIHRTTFLHWCCDGNYKADQLSFQPYKIRVKPPQTRGIS